MANPTPTINQINAFSADTGTTIEFNVVNGTDLIRSNRVYVYDIDTNALICSHLYVSTEFIHELPPSTDNSWSYSSGYSSADFVNNKQYYLQLQTYTNVAGTMNASGCSMSKLFWCLPDPSLYLSNIGAYISTTSYNAIATYNSNITDVDVTVPNVVQQYQFKLYLANGTLVESSDVIVGSGSQVGTSTAYTLSYNFTGLELDTSYYISVIVTTTEGMVLTTRSSTFIVKIDIPKLGSAVVINDSCNGYISVTGNLSGSYSSNINQILVKRMDVNDVTGTWITLYAKNVAKASDMNFTFIDFFNQYGVTYQYALVPVMTQIQNGITVAIEGGYTLSATVESIFDGVYIADNTGIERLKAGVQYGSVDLVRNTATIAPIGTQYPIVISNSKTKYHTGSVSAQIVPANFYSDHSDIITSTYAYLMTSNMQKLLNHNGDYLVAHIKAQEILSRMNMVEQRQILDNFLTNGSAKILKDWNGNIWLVSFIDNVSVTFDNNWGMGMATFTGSWVEIGDANDQEALINTGLVNLGGE